MASSAEVGISGLRRLAAAALVGGLVVAVPVMAATPSLNTRWTGTTSQRSGQIGFLVTAQKQAVLTLGAFRWRCNGRTAVRYFQPSATVDPARGLKIAKDGKFKGTARGVIVTERGKRITRARVGWSGQFKTSRKASGTVRFRGHGCASPVLRWNAKRTR